MNIDFSSQSEFIASAVAFYRRKTVCEDWGFVDHREDIIEWLYKLGRDYNVLNMDYVEFSLVLDDKHKNYRNGSYWKRRIRCYGWHSHFCCPEWYKVLRGFTYNGEEKKDNPTKNDWWEHKGLVKDRRKNRWHTGWRRDLKFFCRRKHRQLEREAIKNERYDRLHRLTYKQAEDPWSWD